MAVLFHGRILSGYEKTEDAEKYGRSHQKAGYPVEKPEESPETHDGYRSPHGGYSPCVHITEHDEGGNAQCDNPYPSARFNLSDTFLCFHDILVLTGEAVVSNFKGRDADRLHWQGFRGKIPERREDDFPRNPEGQTLQVEKGGTLPLPANWNDGVIFSFRSRFSGTRIPCCILCRK
jgi:hypothetical protein